MQSSAYLNFDGQCEAAFRHYEQVLGGKILIMQSHGDSPIADQVPKEWRDQIMHARMQVGDTILMGSDACGGHFEKPQGFAVSLVVDDPADAERIFQAFAADGTVSMPMQETFWASRFGMLVDRFGTPWIINCERPGQSA